MFGPDTAQRRAPAEPAGRPAGPRGEHRRLPGGRDERPPPRPRARGRRPARLLRGGLHPAQPESRRPLARHLGQGLPPRRRRPHPTRLLRAAAGRAGGAAVRAGPRRGPRGLADAARRRAPRRHAALRGRGGGDRDARLGRGAARGAEPHPGRDDLPRPREPARPGQGREGNARRADEPRRADRGAARRDRGRAASGRRWSSGRSASRRGDTSSRRRSRTARAGESARGAPRSRSPRPARR